MPADTAESVAELEKYEAQANAVKLEIAGLSAEQLRAHPVPGTWSIHQIVTHLVDCEQVFANRVKWVLAEENPPLPGFDENKWMSVLAANARPADQSALLIELVRRQVVTILREQPSSAFSRSGSHSQYGRITVSDILKKANWHFEHHMKFLRQKKGMFDGGVTCYRIRVTCEGTARSDSQVASSQ